MRRLAIGPPIIAASLALAALVAALVPLQYQSSATVVLTTPPSGGTINVDPTEAPSEGNPLLQFNDGLRTTTAILINSITTPGTLRSLGVTENGPTELLVDDGRSKPELLSSNGPFIYIEGTSYSQTDAINVVMRAAERIRAELVERQHALGAPPSTFIGVVDVVKPGAPEPVLTQKLEAGGVMFFASLFVGMCTAYGLDRLRSRRRVRKAMREADQGAEQQDRVAKPTENHDEPTKKFRAVKARSGANGNGKLEPAPAEVPTPR